MVGQPSRDNEPGRGVSCTKMPPPSSRPALGGGRRRGAWPLWGPAGEYLIASITIICLLSWPLVGESLEGPAPRVGPASADFGGANRLRHPSRGGQTEKEPTDGDLEAASFAWRPGAHLADLGAARGPRLARAPPGGGVASQTKQMQQSQASSNNNNLDRPKLVQWSRETVQYSEGSTLVLTCSLASAQVQPIKFVWFRQGRPLLVSGAAARLSIDSQADFSFLRLADLRTGDSGAYTCVATSQQGAEDRTTAQVQVNVKLKWIQTTTSSDGSASTTTSALPPLVDTVRAGVSVGFECAATGQPRPRIRWFRLHPQSGGSGRPINGRLDEQLVKSLQLGLESVIDSMSRIELSTRGDFNDTKWQIESIPGGIAGSPNDLLSRIHLDRVDPFSQGIYECEASLELNGQSTANQERIRRQFGLLVNGKCYEQNVHLCHQVESWSNMVGYAN